MRYYRRMPPLLRVAGFLGVALPLAAFVLLMASLTLGQGTHFLSSADVHRLEVIALNLGLLGAACLVILFRRPDNGALLLDTWQRQIRAIGTLSALPLFAIFLAITIPPTKSSFGIVFAASAFAALAEAALYLGLIKLRTYLVRPPQLS